jgi:alpha-1,6-mannosyltransferase
MAVALAILLGFELMSIPIPLTPRVPSPHYVRRGIEYAVLNIIYVLWLVRAARDLRRSGEPQGTHPWASRQDVPDQPFLRLLPPVSIFLILALMSHPCTTDISLYLQYGAMSLEGVNPYTNRAGDFPSALSPFITWYQTCMYGPISLATFMLAATIVPLSIPMAIYALKLACLGFHVLNGFLVWRALNDFSYRNLAALAYLVNPILLLEHVVNGRLDVVLCTSLILTITLIRKHSDWSVGLAIWGGVLAKTLPVIWFPLYVFYLFRHRRWASLGAITLLSIAIVVALSITLLPSFAAWGSMLNPGVKWRVMGSLHALFGGILDTLGGVLPEIISRKKSSVVYRLGQASYAVYCVGYAVLVWRLLFDRLPTAEDLISYLGWATLALLLLASPWYQPWYATILLPFVALNLRARFFAITSSTYAVSSSLAYYILSYSADWLPQLGVSVFTVAPPIVLIVLRVTHLSAAAKH